MHYDVVLYYPDETSPYHRVFFIDRSNGIALFGVHERQLFDIGVELINAHGLIYEPELMARA